MPSIETTLSKIEQHLGVIASHLTAAVAVPEPDSTPVPEAEAAAPVEETQPEPEKKPTRKKAAAKKETTEEETAPKEEALAAGTLSEEDFRKQAKAYLVQNGDAGKEALRSALEAFGWTRIPDIEPGRYQDVMTKVHELAAAAAEAAAEAEAGDDDELDI